MGKQILKIAAILLSILCLAVGTGKSSVSAKEEETVTCFSGDVAVLKQEEHGYVMQVTVENGGKDFAGTVQVIFTNSEYTGSAYNTELTLPAQGKKQFTINVTNTAVDVMRGGCALNFLDEEGNLLQSIERKDIFGNALTEITVGVLSDNYAELTFMEAKGQTIDIYNGSYPLKLTQLSDENLKDQLEGVYFLIIDQFDVSSLSREDIEAIQDWVRNGGWLMIGTGEYGTQTLSGFDKDFMDVSVVSVSKPGEENIASANASPYGYDYYMYTDDGVDLTNMAVADLSWSIPDGFVRESSENPAISSSLDDGAVLIFYFSLGDKELQKLSSYTVMSIYSEFTYGRSGYLYNDYWNWDYINERLLAFIDTVNTNVDFTGLKIMILVYVVLAGPAIYLILRRMKKQEWYWICAPALGVVFIAGVYFLGQGVKVREARMYSVTAQKVDSDRKDTYFLAYHSGTKPWTVPLAADYEMAGPGSAWDGYYYGSYGQGADDYCYLVENGGEQLSAGMKPEENFESGFFYAAGRTESKGTISCENLQRKKWQDISGKITNGTDYDMPYMAVWFEDCVKVFSDVKAGETIDLEQAKKDGRCVYENADCNYDNLLYDMISVYDPHADLGYVREDMAALLVGIGIADNARPAGGEQAVIIGVVKDYEKTAADKCSEVSYGCLYSYAKIGGQNASD